MIKNKLKWTYALWAKIVLALVCAVSAAALLISTIGMLFIMAYPDYKDELDGKYENIAMNYSAYALQLLTDGNTAEEVQQILGKKAPNFKFALVSSTADSLQQVDLDEEDSWMIGSPEAADQYRWLFAGSENEEYVYSLADINSGNLGSFYAYGYESENNEDGTSIPVTALVYDPDTGIFYLRSVNTYYVIPEVEMTVEIPLTWNLVSKLYQEAYGTLPVSADQAAEESLSQNPDRQFSDQEWNLLDEETRGNLEDLFDGGVTNGCGSLRLHGTLEDNAGEAYRYHSEFATFPDAEKLNDYVQYWTEVSPWDSSRISYQTGISREATDLVQEKALPDDADIITEQEFSWDNPYDFSEVVLTEDKETQNYWVLSWVPETIDTSSDDLFAQWAKILPVVYGIGRWIFLVQLFSLIILAVSVFLLGSALGHRRGDDRIHLRFADRIPYLLWILFIFPPLEFLLIRLLWCFLADMDSFGSVNSILLSIETIIAGMLLGEEVVATTIVRIKGKVFRRYTLWHYIAAAFHRMADAVREHIPQFVRLLLAVCAVALLELMLVFTAIDNCSEGAYFLFFLIKIAESVILLFVGMQWCRLHEGSKKIAAGDLDAPVDTSKLRGEFKEHGENLNHISDAIEAAVQKEMKSEHFQTELITNVSHDIKTPLTSIINYVDLMKKEDITDPKLQEYVAVLDRQSGKLKKLIEDLMEASKASTGNLTVNLEETDAAILLQQAVGEFEERLEKNHLQVVVTSPEPPVTIIADGRHLWRVFDNLLSNICKYALPGSRVYIDLTQKDGKTTIVFRNISAAQLNITSEELMARFVRGDASRSTEGSGLGLNIAQSLMTLMKGSLKLDVDGDLFKVTLEF